MHKELQHKYGTRFCIKKSLIKILVANTKIESVHETTQMLIFVSYRVQIAIISHYFEKMT